MDNSDADCNHTRAEHKMLSLLALRVDRPTIERFVMDVYNSWAGSSSQVEHDQAIEFLAIPLQRAAFQGLKSNDDVRLMDEILSSGVPWDDEELAETDREYGKPILLLVSLLILHLFREGRDSGIDALLAYPVVFTQVVRCASSIGDPELHEAVVEYLRATAPHWKDAELRTLARLAACALDTLRVSHELAACIEALTTSPRLEASSSFWTCEPLASARSLFVGDIRRVTAALRDACESTARFASSIDPPHDSGT